MSENRPKRRTSQITIRLEPKILEGLSELGDRFGIAPTTLAGLAIGEYVSKNLAAIANASNLSETIGKELANALAAPLVGHFEGKSFDELKAIFSDD